MRVDFHSEHLVSSGKSISHERGMNSSSLKRSSAGSVGNIWYRPPNRNRVIAERRRKSLARPAEDSSQSVEDKNSPPRTSSTVKSSVNCLRAALAFKQKGHIDFEKTMTLFSLIKVSILAWTAILISGFSLDAFGNARRM
jgi:hypothetical protein